MLRNTEKKKGKNTKSCQKTINIKLVQKERLKKGKKKLSGEKKIQIKLMKIFATGSHIVYILL